MFTSEQMKGNQYAKGKGRKGYIFEKEQQELITKETGEFLKLARKIREHKATRADIKAYKLLAPVMKKVMDKVHPDKANVKFEGDRPILVL